MFKKFSFSFLALSSVLAASLQEEWIIDEHQKSQWEDLLKQHEIPLDYLQQVLSAHDLVRISFGKSHDLPTPTSREKQHLKEPTLIYKGQGVEVYYPGEPRVRHHLWIVLERPVVSFLEVSKDELIQMKHVENTIRKILSEQFELSSIIAQSNQPQPGQIPDRFTIEVIPGRADSKTVHNVLDKTDCNSYVIFRDQFTAALPPPIETESQNDIEFWKKALSNASANCFSKETAHQPIKAWTQVQTNLALAKRKLIDDFYQVLIENNLHIERTSLPHETLDEPLVSDKSGCSFCIEKVVQSQKVYETNLSYLLYNYKSAIPGSHFLIVPKRHVHDCADLREDEIQDMQELAQKLTLALQIEKNRSDVKMYIQDGPTVGQTVPHVNMHVLLTPSTLKYMLFSINYDQEKTLSLDQMKPLVEGIRKQLHHLPKGNS